MAGEVLDWPASPETIDFPLDFLDPGRGAGAKSAPRTGSRFFVKKSPAGPSRKNIFWSKDGATCRWRLNSWLSEMRS